MAMTMAMTMAMAMGESRGSIAFFGTYRPPIPLDIFSSTGQHGVRQDELLLTDGESYNQNGEAIPPAALRELLTYLCKSTNSKLLLAPETCTPEDAENGRVTGMLFVSERDDGLETLHVALRFAKDNTVKVLRLADIYGADAFGGVRMEDSGCIAGGFKVAGGRAVGHSLLYVSTKEAVKDRRAPWTVVYKTNLADGSTERLTPPGQYDLSPAVSPSGKTVAVANFRFNEWTGEIEHLNTDIVVMNVDRQAQGGLGRRILIRDAGWPSWGSDKVIFFHRGIPAAGSAGTRWRVFRYDLATGATDAVTPEDYFVAITPAAISETKVAVATIRRMSKFSDDRVEAQYRHIEVFDVSDDVRGGKGKPLQVTSGRRPKADHYNPFVLDGGRRVGYHRCRTDRLLEIKDESQTNRSIERKFDKVRPPASHPDVGLFRVSGVFPTVSKDGRKLAFVDNEFKTVWLADGDGLRDVYTVDDGTSIFSTSWNQKDALDILYVCQGPAFSAAKTVEIYILQGVSGPKDDIDKRRLTAGGFNNAFPSSSPDGTMLVFRSTRDRVHADAADKETQREYKNLFVMNATTGEFGGGGTAKPRQLTDGEWTDTHCSWSPREGCGWIVFSSTRDKPNQKQNVPPLDQGLDPGYFAVYLVNADDLLPDDGKLPAPVRVIRSSPTLAGHINHPVFSPDMRTIVFAADLAAVSCEPISMPLFLHSVRPYGDIFSVDLRDTNDVARNKDIAGFHRITHSRYEYSTPAWAAPADGDDDPNSKWKLPNDGSSAPPPACPYAYPAAGEGWYVAGHITVERRCC